MFEICNFFGNKYFLAYIYVCILVYMFIALTVTVI